MKILLKTFWVFLLLFALIGCSDSNNNLEFKGNIYEDSTSILFLIQTALLFVMYRELY